MDNYKIKVKYEAESKEAQELLKQLGYKIECFVPAGFPRWIATTNHGEDYWYSTGFELVSQLGRFQELTLPQLRDLVVLKRNDINDANCIDKKREAWYLASDGTYYAWQYRKLCWDTESDACVEAHDIKPIKKHLETATGRFDENGEHHLTFSNGMEEKDPALISGADVPRLIKEGNQIQLRAAIGFKLGEWKDLNLERDEEELTLGDLINSRFEWRLKPQTIKLELELPKPFEPKEGEKYWIITDEYKLGYTSTYSSNGLLGKWRTEDEIKQVVEQLRKIRGAS